jgi:hypothetical protein
MPRYFFDSRDGETFIRDEDGVVCDDIDGARDQAAVALAELARDILPGLERRELIIDVRDEDDQPVLKTCLIFEATRLR